MNKICIYTLVLSGALLSPVAYGANPQTNSVNLIPNPGLEQGGKMPSGGWKPHFFITGEWADYSNAEWADGVAHSGKKSIKVAVKVTTGRTLDWGIPSINVKGYKRLKLSFWMKTANIRSGRQPWKTAHVTLYIHYGKKGMKSLSCGRAEGDTDWTRYEKVFDLPEGATTIRLSAGLSLASGVAWFDDFSLSPTDEAVTKSVLVSKLNFPVSADQPIVLPLPKQAEYMGEIFPLKRITVMGNIPPSMIQILKEILGVEGTVVEQIKDPAAIDAQCVVIVGRSDQVLDSKPLRDILSKDDLKSSLLPEGYLLRVWKEHDKVMVLVCGKDYPGIFYGLQTMRQLIRKDESGITIPECRIVDWPDMALRGIPTGWRSDSLLKQIAAVKMNLLFMCMKEGQQYIDRELTTEEKQDLRNIVAKTSNMYIKPVASIRPATYKIWEDSWFRYGDPAHLQRILDRCADYYRAGFRNFGLHFDDIPSHKFNWPEDKKQFGTLGEAHLYVAGKMYEYLKKLDPANEMFFIPMYYGSPRISCQVEETKQYLREVSKLNKDVIFVFCGIFTTEDTEFCKSIVRNRRVLIWDNYLAQYERKYEGKPGFSELIEPLSVFVKNSRDLSTSVLGYIFLMPLDNLMAWQMSADYLWNSQEFIPNKSAAMSMKFLRDECKNNKCK